MSAKKTLLRATVSLTLIVFVSKAIGFVREMIMAAYFGSGMLTDAYNAAYSLFYLPVLLFSSCITSTLMPEYLNCERELGRSGSDRFGSNAINLFSLLALVISALMFAFAVPLTKLIYPGFEGEQLALAVKLGRIMFPALVFFVAALALSSLLNAREKYIAAQLTGLPLSFSLILAAVLFSGSYGINAQAWGIIAAGIGQVAILVPCLAGAFSYKPVIDIGDKRIRRLAVIAMPAMLSMAVNELNHMIDRMLASTLNTGDISAMSYAFKLIMFMLGVLAVPMTTVSFAKLSLAKREDKKLVRKQVRDSIAFLLEIMLPIVVIAACCSRQIIRLAYCRGAFTEENVAVTGSVFLFYVIGVPFFGLRDLMNRVYHSFSDTRTPMRVAMISMVLNIGINLALKPVMGANGLALATGIAALTGVVLLVRGLRRIVKGVFSKDYIVRLIRLVLANVPVLVCAAALSRLLPDAFGTIRVFFWLAGVTAVSMAVYAVSIVYIGGVNLGELMKPFTRRLAPLFRRLIKR